MLSIILDQFIKKSKFRDNLVRASFFTFQGIVGSILLNDILRILYGNFEHKKIVEYGIIGAISVMPNISNKLVLMENKTNNYFMSFGMIIGLQLCDISERGHGGETKE